MGLYKRITPAKTTISRNETTEGRTIEKAWEQLMQDGQIKVVGKETLYPNEGIPYGTDIRANFWDKAIAETEKVTKAVTAWRKKKADQRKAELEALNQKQQQASETPTTGTATSE